MLARRRQTATAAALPVLLEALLLLGLLSWRLQSPLTEAVASYVFSGESNGQRAKQQKENVAKLEIASFSMSDGRVENSAAIVRPPPGSTPPSAGRGVQPAAVAAVWV